MQKGLTKIFEANQIKKIDRLVCEEKGISSYEWMNDAVCALSEELLRRISPNAKVCILAGTGNNGGDALVLARHLKLLSIRVDVYLVRFDHSLSLDCQQALADLEKSGVHPFSIQEYDGIRFDDFDFVLDGLFGTGLNRPLGDEYLRIVGDLNNSGCKVFSIDMPSGLCGEKIGHATDCPIVKADITFTFQQPKLAFLFPENEMFVGEVVVVDLHIPQSILDDTPSNLYLVGNDFIQLHKRDKFSHKGTFGKGLLVAGKYGMAGAAILASRACLRSGCGLLTVHVPSKLYEIVQTSVPEAILDFDDDSQQFSLVDGIEKYTAIGIGPGIGTNECSLDGLKNLLDNVAQKPMVIDADALNILSRNKELYQILPNNCILTPHPAEFDRLFGLSKDSYERLQKQRQFAHDLGIIIVLKGHATSVALPDGETFFNTTGNSGMATAGSGDVLTGIILSLLCQGYDPSLAAIYGVYLHGLAGDLALKEGVESEESMLASDIINHLGRAFNCLKTNSQMSDF